jgi:PAS domain S-box-containing protein
LERDVNLDRRILLPAVVLFAAAVFTVDVMTPVGVEIWVLYLPVILAPVLINNARHIVLASATCSVFLILGEFLSWTGAEPKWSDALNRGMGLVAIWLMALAGRTIVKRSLQIAQTMQSLEEEIVGHEKAKRALAESEERLRLAMAGAGMGTWDVDLHTGEANWSDKPFRMTGFDPAQDGETNWERWLSRDHAEDLGQLLDQETGVQRPDSIVSSEVRIRRASNGEIVWLAVFGRFLGDESGAAARFSGVSFDITQRKELEREALEIVAREQRRIGRELHDSVGQELTGLGLMAHTLGQSLKESDHSRRIAFRLLGGIERVHEQIRVISHGLVPFQIEAGGFYAALESLASRSGDQAGIDISFESPDGVEVPDDTTARQLFRIAQEAVNNAIRHGKARQVRLILDAHAYGLRLRIQDDGVGIAAQSRQTDGMGVRIMRYRAGLVGGVLRIDSLDKRGTLVTCTVPQRHDDDPEPDGYEDTGSTEGSSPSAHRR